MVMCECQQYYVENSHLPIISKRDYELTQAMLKSKNDNSNRKGHIFTHKIVCPDCGRFFRHLQASNKSYWICPNRANGMDACSPYRFSEEAIFKTIANFNAKLFLCYEQMLSRICAMLMEVEYSQNTVDIKLSELMGLSKVKGDVDPSTYDEVFSGNVDCENLEDVFARFNTEGHPLHRGHSLSVSDVVLAENGAFFCDTIGFKGIDFDESKAHKPDSLLQIVYVEPNRPPFVSEVSNDLKSLQRAVCGYIEPIYLGDGTILVGNEEAKLKGMEGNRHIGESIIAGPFFIVGEDDDNFRSLTDDEAQRYMERFAEPEQISQQEAEGDMGFTLHFF